MSTGRGEIAGTGTQSAAFAAGGGSPGNKATEEFTIAVVLKTVKTVDLKN